MTIGYFSPMPPASTGVADYSAALLPHLGPVRLNQDGDVNLYHIGNNTLHREIHQRALAKPGVIVLHDAVLQHFYLGTLDEAAYVEEFVYNYGEWSRGQAQELWRERARSGADARYFARPMLRRILEQARAVIVHNPAAAAIAREHAPNACMVEIPHLFVPPQLPDAVETLRLRRSLGLGPRTLLVGTFGHQRETKRLAVLLRAFKQAMARGIDARLLVSGEFVSEAYGNAMDTLLRHPHILRTGHLPEPAFWRHLAATDLCVNLRYPSAAESSGVAIRMMGIGKAVAFSDDDAVRRIPANACLRIDTGAAEEEMLADYIVWLAERPGSAAAIGANAARHIAQDHAAEKIGVAYRDLLRDMSVDRSLTVAAPSPSRHA
jgi:glycosyltransferase involved in cell wall biosynthesis